MQLGYCSLDYPGGLCTFQCSRGPHIRSSCTCDGTWDPYPTCDGDVRELEDGCNPCPGPVGSSGLTYEKYALGLSYINTFFVIQGDEKVNHLAGDQKEAADPEEDVPEKFSRPASMFVRPSVAVCSTPASNLVQKDVDKQKQNSAAV